MTFYPRILHVRLDAGTADACFTFIVPLLRRCAIARCDACAKRCTFRFISIRGTALNGEKFIFNNKNIIVWLCAAAPLMSSPATANMRKIWTYCVERDRAKNTALQIIYQIVRKLGVSEKLISRGASIDEGAVLSLFVTSSLLLVSLLHTDKLWKRALNAGMIKCETTWFRFVVLSICSRWCVHRWWTSGVALFAFLFFVRTRIRHR